MGNGRNNKMNQSHPIRDFETSAAFIGSIAFESLAEERMGSILGITSQGIFIKTSSKWLNFLSFEGFRGPLTINLSRGENSILEIKVGMVVETSPGYLSIPDAAWKVSLVEAEVWVPRAPAGEPASGEFRRGRLVSLGNKIMASRMNSGLAPVLPRLLEITGTEQIDDKDQPALHNQILKLQLEMKSYDSLPPLAELVSLLGSGSGLTPSGDDFILGMLLALNRWKILFPKLSDLEMLNREIVEATYQRTTTLSANLIECATLGLGNERLIDTLDWILSGSDDESIPVENLLTWGSSSGIDAFVGYVVALSKIAF